MTITEKTAYLKGLLEGLDIDRSTNEGKLLAAIVETMDEIALSVADLDDEMGAVNDELDTLEETIDAIDEEIDDMEETLDAIDEDLDDMDDELEELYEATGLDIEDEEDSFDDDEDEDEDLYQLTCPTCQEEIVVDEDVLAKGGMKCPACGEELDFDLSAVIDELADDKDEE